MKTKTVLGLIAAALVAACTSTPRWDASVFPQQAVYDAGSPVVAEIAK